MSTGYLSYGKCFDTVQEAAADWHSYQPVLQNENNFVRPASITSISGTLTDAGLTSRLVYFDFGISGSNYSTNRRFYQCEITDPISELFPGYTADDYMEAGWLVAGSWITVWLIMLALKARRY